MIRFSKINDFNAFIKNIHKCNYFSFSFSFKLRERCMAPSMVHYHCLHWVKVTSSLSITAFVPSVQMSTRLKTANILVL